MIHELAPQQLADLERRAKRCKSHHYACDCRELAYQKRIAELQHIARSVQALNEYPWFMPCTLPETCGKYSERYQDEMICIACQWRKELARDVKAVLPDREQNEAQS